MMVFHNLQAEDTQKFLKFTLEAERVNVQVQGEDSVYRTAIGKAAGLLFESDNLFMLEVS